MRHSLSEYCLRVSTDMKGTTFITYIHKYFHISNRNDLYKTTEYNPHPSCIRNLNKVKVLYLTLAPKELLTQNELSRVGEQVKHNSCYPSLRTNPQPRYSRYIGNISFQCPHNIHRNTRSLQFLQFVFLFVLYYHRNRSSLRKISAMKFYNLWQCHSEINGQPLEQKS